MGQALFTGAGVVGSPIISLFEKLKGNPELAEANKEQSIMIEQDILKRISILFQQLELMNLYEEEFLGILGKQGYFKRINNILDEINLWKKVLNEKHK